MPDLNHANHVGIEFAEVGAELQATVMATSLTTTTLLATVGATIKLVYISANTRWELPDGTVPDLTGRTASILWEGTSDQIPAQGEGDSDFQTGDTAFVRETTL